MRIFYKIQQCPKLSNKILHWMAVWFSLTLIQMSSVGVYQVSSSPSNSKISPVNLKDYTQLVYIVDIKELM